MSGLGVSGILILFTLFLHEEKTHQYSRQFCTWYGQPYAIQTKEIRKHINIEHNKNEGMAKGYKRGNRAIGESGKQGRGIDVEAHKQKGQSKKAITIDCHIMHIGSL